MLIPRQCTGCGPLRASVPRAEATAPGHPVPPKNCGRPNRNIQLKSTPTGSLRPAVNVCDADRNAGHTCYPSSPPAEATRTTPSSSSSSNQPRNETFEPPISDQIPGRGNMRLENLAYSAYLGKIQHMVPGVSRLAFLTSRSSINKSEPRLDQRPYIPGEHIIVAEILGEKLDNIRWHDIDCADANSLEQHAQVFGSPDVPEGIRMRYLVMDDISARAIEVLGHNFRLDFSVFAKHLHQGLEGRPVEDTDETFVSPLPEHTATTPFALRDACTCYEADKSYMMICPTDMHMVPVSNRSQRDPIIISSGFEELQSQRAPNRDSPSFLKNILRPLGCRSFMSPSICKDFGPYLPTWQLVGEDDPDDSNPFHRITLERSDRVIIHVARKTAVPTSKGSLKSITKGC